MSKTLFKIVKNDKRISLVGGGQELYFEVSDTAFLAEDDAYAAWALAPLAMGGLGDIVIEGMGDSVTEKNVKELTRIWSQWVPGYFEPASITFTNHQNTNHLKERHVNAESDILLFSGGVDATYNLLSRHRQGLKQTLLTLQGLDYPLDRDDLFEDLIKKTDAIAHLTESPRLFMATNAYRAYGNVNKKYNSIGNVGLTHGFVLAAALFLMNRGFRAGVISADYAQFQEYIVAPWGTNSLTNSYFKSNSFEMKVANLDVTRTQKVKYLLSCPEALTSVAFCRDKTSKPYNCGKCSKCIRTKLMFLAVAGKVPEIFSDISVSEKMLRVLDIQRPTEKIFFVDLVTAAKEHNNISLIPGLERTMNKALRPPSPITRFIQKQRKSLKKRMPTIG